MSTNRRKSLQFLGFLSACFFLNSALAIDSERDAAEKIAKEERQADSYNILRHNLNYVISGNPDTKVQFSFKLQPVADFDLYLGYTQTMFWNLGKESNPFSDVNYNPEIFIAGM